MSETRPTTLRDQFRRDVCMQTTPCIGRELQVSVRIRVPRFWCNQPELPLLWTRTALQINLIGAPIAAVAVNIPRRIEMTLPKPISRRLPAPNVGAVDPAGSRERECETTAVHAACRSVGSVNARYLSTGQGRNTACLNVVSSLHG